MRRTVSVLLVDEVGRILIQKRDGSSKIWNPGAWGTFGGQIEDGESPAEACLREIKEELDYDLGEFNFLFRCDYKDGSKSTYVYYKFVSELEKDSFKLLEGCDWGWFTIDEIAKMNWKLGDVLRKRICDVWLSKRSDDEFFWKA